MTNNNQSDNDNSTPAKTPAPATEPPAPIRSEAAPQRPVEESPMGEFLAFRRFATPVLVKIAFWIGTLVCLVLGMNTIDAANQGWRGTNAAMVWTGVLTITLGPLLLRIAGELILVVFRINERLAALEPHR
ncbi:DUF4282 domain-containing protein [Wenzhouxiangella marina]|uniref:Uncharacterized protein n=1 Tax=Wenzhouxiangella marina TaxID=1579979 RepID=A0A0K0XUI4_9GAMM|nr:DUF4282 domain-containing protein [Wenzhouxiangella marina]AKS41374.1 hypothetical protein WM2015_997 [Wenzhouxiangella marina]MBB6086872.1 hypothetical protein [Wenzhouxiangella marina]